MKQYNNIDEWKTEVNTSGHILETDVLKYSEQKFYHPNQSFVSAYLVPNGTEGWRSVLIGAYELYKNKGWVHL